VHTYIENHLGEQISLGLLARQTGLSRFHFARQFRHTVGETPMGYLRRMRIERAKQILLRHERTIAGVAADLGFPDQSHFTKVFSRFVGISPGLYARTGRIDSDSDGTARMHRAPITSEKVLSGLPLMEVRRRRSSPAGLRRPGWRWSDNPINWVNGPLKVSGPATYAYEHWDAWSSGRA
jgi:AraC-like DNA-binding protein